MAAPAQTHDTRGHDEKRRTRREYNLLAGYSFFMAPVKDDFAILVGAFLVGARGMSAGPVNTLTAIRESVLVASSVPIGKLFDQTLHPAPWLAFFNLFSLAGTLILMLTQDFVPLVFRAVITGLCAAALFSARNGLLLAVQQQNDDGTGSPTKNGRGHRTRNEDGRTGSTTKNEDVRPGVKLSGKFSEEKFFLTRHACPDVPPPMFRDFHVQVSMLFRFW